MNSNAYLGQLYYDIGRQMTNFFVARAFLINGNPCFTKWKTMLEYMENPLRVVNQRTQLINEVNLEYDHLAGFDKLIKQLIKENVSFRAFQTHTTRSTRIETFWKEMFLMTDELRKMHRIKIIKRYGGDIQLATTKHMVSFGKHYKTNLEIKIVYSNLIE